MKYIEIERAKRLEDSIGLFSNSDGRIDIEYVEIQNEDGSKHIDSDKLINASMEINKSLKIIKDILIR